MIDKMLITDMQFETKNVFKISISFWRISQCLNAAIYNSHTQMVARWDDKALSVFILYCNCFSLFLHSNEPVSSPEPSLLSPPGSLVSAMMGLINLLLKFVGDSDVRDLMNGWEGTYNRFLCWMFLQIFRKK